MTNCDSITLGYNLDSWKQYGLKEPITADISASQNSHILIVGASGSGKSYASAVLLARLILSNPNGELYFADYKQEDDFSYLRDCPRYYGYHRTTDALDAIYDRLHRRQSGEDQTRHQITIYWDEYVADMLSLQSRDKKQAQAAMNKVAEILMLGRSLRIRIVTSCQRPRCRSFRGREPAELWCLLNTWDS